MPARQRRSSTSRTSSRDANVSDDVEDEEDRPDDLRHLERAAILRRVAREVGLDVQRRDDAEDDREDAADEHGEEVVDARAAAAQPVEPLQVEAERDEHGDERQDVEVLPERRNALGDRDEAASGTGARTRG